jgi:LysM repeat protein
MRLSVILAVLALMSVTPAYAQTAPPHPLHKVGDHWTPYDPPQTFEVGIQPYIIQPGDTLWDLAKKNLGDPYLWPQIWEQNKYITDAHWIYPGDPLVMPKKMEAVTETQTPSTEEQLSDEWLSTKEYALGDEVTYGGKRWRSLKDGNIGHVPEEGEWWTEVGVTPSEGTPLPEGPVSKPIAIGDESDIYCFSTVLPIDTKYPFHVVGSDDPQVRFTLTQDQIIYIDAGSAEGIQAGDEFFIAQDEGALKDGNKTLGRLWMYTGRLIVLCAQEKTSTARVTVACRSVYRGNVLIPFKTVPIPARVLPPFSTTCTTVTGKITGRIIYSKDDVVSLFQGHMVIVNLGSADNIQPGDLLRVYRYVAEEGAGRIVLGRLGILTVQDHTATARILESTRDMMVGDEFELE